MHLAVECGVALGSNLGDRAGFLQRGVKFLKSLADDEAVEVSPFYETVPVDCPAGSQDFINAVAVFRFSRDPMSLLRSLREFERECGRAEVYQRNSPRPLDLDLLFYGADVIDHAPELILPHPRLSERAFVLAPLADLRPHLVLPGYDISVRELMDRCADRASVRHYVESRGTCHR